MDRPLCRQQASSGMEEVILHGPLKADAATGQHRPAKAGPYRDGLLDAGRRKTRVRGVAGEGDTAAADTIRLASRPTLIA